MTVVGIQHIIPSFHQFLLPPVKYPPVDKETLFIKQHPILHKAVPYPQIIHFMPAHSQLGFPTCHISIHQQVKCRIYKCSTSPNNQHQSLRNLIYLRHNPAHLIRIKISINIKPREIPENTVISHVLIGHRPDFILFPHHFSGINQQHRLKVLIQSKRCIFFEYSLIILHCKHLFLIFFR
ncbi:hypothetical protein SDC9_185298 [bioreactor metagenome]|uniref:Uncharacterized protein n=1 Tax=bioreactor metagenome TaxID=1076179 RepID=A0A645HFF7_9ZZZZ